MLVGQFQQLHMMVQHQPVMLPRLPAVALARHQQQVLLQPQVQVLGRTRNSLLAADTAPDLLLQWMWEQLELQHHKLAVLQLLLVLGRSQPCPATAAQWSGQQVPLLLRLAAGTSQSRASAHHLARYTSVDPQQQQLPGLRHWGQVQLQLEQHMERPQVLQLLGNLLHLVLLLHNCKELPLLSSHHT